MDYVISARIQEGLSRPEGRYFATVVVEEYEEHRGLYDKPKRVRNFEVPLNSSGKRKAEGKIARFLFSQGIRPRHSRLKLDIGF